MSNLSKPLQRKLNTELGRFKRAFAKKIAAVEPLPSESFQEFTTKRLAEFEAAYEAETARLMEKLTESERLEIVAETIRRNVVQTASAIMLASASRSLPSAMDVGTLLAELLRGGPPTSQSCGDPKCHQCGMPQGGDPKRN